MKEYLKKVKELIEKFGSAKVYQIPRKENTKANSLARLNSTIQSKEPRIVLVELMIKPSIAQMKFHQVQTA